MQSLSAAEEDSPIAVEGGSDNDGGIASAKRGDDPVREGQILPGIG